MTVNLRSLPGRMMLGAVIACLPALVSTVSAAPRDNSRNEAKLAKALEGRVAGKPVDCLYQRDIRSSRIYDRTAIVYETSGGTLYVNRPRSGATSLDSNDILVTDTHSSQLCSIDVVQLYDNGSRMQNGFVGLGPFVPYVKPKAATARH
jgi:hypothetical protein